VSKSWVRGSIVVEAVFPVRADAVLTLRADAAVRFVLVGKD
jgi:hypothetical protein